MSYEVLHMPARLDHQNMHHTWERIEESLAKETPVLILNFDNCEFMDSSGLGMLVHATAIQDKDVRLVELQPKVRNILKLTQVDKILHVFNTLDSALV